MPETEQRTAELEDWRTKHEARHRTLDEHIQVLSGDIKEIRAAQGNMATKADIAEINRHIDISINTILRDALNAVPAKHAAMWAGIVALLTIGSLVLAYVRH